MIRATVSIVGGRPVIAQLLGEALAAGEIVSFHISEQVDVELSADEILASIRGQLEAEGRLDRLTGDLLDPFEYCPPLVETVVPVGGVL